MKNTWKVTIAANHIEPKRPKYTSIYIIAKNNQRIRYYVNKYEVFQENLSKFYKNFKKNKKNFIIDTLPNEGFSTLKKAILHIQHRIILDSELTICNWYTGIQNKRKLPEVSSKLFKYITIYPSQYWMFKI